jgi:hypothetical protein
MPVGVGAASQRLIPTGRTILIADAHRGDGGSLLAKQLAHRGDGYKEGR